MRSLVHTSKCLKDISTRPLAFTSTFFLSFFEHIANLSIAFFVLKGFGLELGLPFISEWIIICSICFILFASITFIPTPGNSGAADLSFFLLFETVLYAGLAFPAMLVWRLFSFYSTIIVGFTFATLKKKSDLKKANLEQAESKQAEAQDELCEKGQALYEKTTPSNTKDIE